LFLRYGNVIFGGTPPPNPKKEKGHIPDFFFGEACCIYHMEMVTIGLAVFEKFLGKGFPFRPPRQGSYRSGKTGKSWGICLVRESKGKPYNLKTVLEKSGKMNQPA